MEVFIRAPQLCASFLFNVLSLNFLTAQVIKFVALSVQ